MVLPEDSLEFLKDVGKRAAILEALRHLGAR